MYADVSCNHSEKQTQNSIVYMNYQNQILKLLQALVFLISPIPILFRFYLIQLILTNTYISICLYA